MKILRFLVPAAFLLVACSPVAPEAPKSPESGSPSIGMPVIDADGNPSFVDEMEVTEDAGGDGDAMEVPQSDASTETRTVQMTTADWAFSPTSIILKKGENVSLELTGIEGVHGIGIPDLGVNQRVEPGKTVTVAIPTDTAGTFTFFCNVPCGAGHKEMKGTIVIEE